jgi:hypothetical protein
MIVDDPETLAEVTALFAAYETALVTNDVPVLDGFFRDAPEAIRYGVRENLYGFAEIQAFRAARPGQGLERALERTSITTYGRDLATCSTLFHRDSSTRIGRQMQTWVRFPEGWRIVAAHVSLMEA